MEEALIKYETAKLAWEKQFKQPVTHYFRFWYGEIQEKHLDCNKDNYNSFYFIERDKEHYFSRPTQALLQTWLREKHDVFVFVQPVIKNVMFPMEYKFIIYSIDGNIVESVYTGRSYEEMLEDGLIEGMKLI